MEDTLSRNITAELTMLIGECLGEAISPDSLNQNAPLFGAMLDSMAVTNLIMAIEDHFRFSFDEEELVAEAFETLGALEKLISKKLGNSTGAKTA